MFVKWECGCKGLIADGRNIVIYCCDGEGGLCFIERDMTDQRGMIVRPAEYKQLTDEQKCESVPKSYSPLPAEEAAKFIEQIGQLVCDGYALRRLQSIIEFKWEESDA